MKEVIETLEDYLDKTLGVQIKTHPWKEKLPFFLIDHYKFYKFTFLAQPCLLMIAREDVEVSPATIRKHLEQVQKKWRGLCIYVQEALPSYKRSRLIEYRVPFIVPNNQIYLPDLGLDLREHFRKLKSKKTTLTPATQAVLIYVLCSGNGGRFNPSELSGQLDYSQMTMTRAFDEFEAMGIGEIQRKGKKRCWVVPDNLEQLWEQALPLMRDPVKKRKWVKIKDKKPKIHAGLSALAHFSMLNPPPLPVFAMDANEWKGWKRNGIQEVPDPEDATFEVEIWSYNPNLFAQDKTKTVDFFSLYLSLHNTKDERIESALEEMKGKIKW